MIVRSGARFRGLAAAAATVGVVALAMIVAPIATAAPDEGSGNGQAPAKSLAIRPGVVTESGGGGGGCTSNFIFTSGDRTFIGQAAHCAGTGDATETNGCNSGSAPIGTVVVIKANDGTDRVGKLAYSSWLTMQKIGETDVNACQFNDFALVELSAADKADINPTVPFFGGPTGLDRGGVAEGEQVFSYGNSPLRQGVSELSPKSGQNVGDFGGGWSHEVVTPLTPGVPGDSGSGFLDSDGDAMGVLSTLNLAPLPGTNGVVDMAMALDYANAHGDLGKIELVLGTGGNGSSGAA